MKMGFIGSSGIGGSVRWHRRLRQGSGEAKMVFDTSGSSGDVGDGGEQRQCRCQRWEALDR